MLCGGYNDKSWPKNGSNHDLNSVLIQSYNNVWTKGTQTLQPPQFWHPCFRFLNTKRLCQGVFLCIGVLYY